MACFEKNPYFSINEKQIQNERGCDYIGIWGPGDILRHTYFRTTKLRGAYGRRQRLPAT